MICGEDVGVNSTEEFVIVVLSDISVADILIKQILLVYI